MKPSAELLSVQNLSVEIDDMVILDDISFGISQGQLVHIKGSNGAGKTTLLRVLSGLMPTSGGKILFDGSISQTDIGYVGHKAAIEANLTVEENIQASLLCEFPKVKIEQALVFLQLNHYRFHFSCQLSQGQKKRVSLARFFCLERKLWLLDEPFTALDVKFQATLKQAMIDFVEAGGSIILTSHMDIQFENISSKELLL